MGELRRLIGKGVGNDAFARVIGDFFLAKGTDGAKDQIAETLGWMFWWWGSKKRCLLLELSAMKSIWILIDVGLSIFAIERPTNIALKRFTPQSSLFKRRDC